MYTFPGVHPFIERVAARTGRDPHQAGRTRGLWHVARIQDALGYLPRQDPASQRESLLRIRHLRDGLALALEGVDAAIEDVLANLNPQEPKPKRRA